MALLSASHRRSCGAPRTPLTAASALLMSLLFSLLLAASSALATDVSGTAWLSAPASIWSAATSSSATELTAAIEADFTAAITAIDSAATVSVTALTVNTAPASGPAYGTDASYTVTGTTMTAADIDACLRAATLTNVNSAFSSYASDLALTITVLNAADPTSVTQVTEAYLPVSGPAFMWQTILQTVAAAGTLPVAAFVIPVEKDLQSTVDATARNYLVVVPTTTTDFIVNASSLYVKYAVWSYPTNTDTSTDAALRALANTTSLTAFNAFVAGLQTTYPALADYADLIPTKVTTWAPLVYDPLAGTGSSSGSVVVLEGNVSGNYILMFSGTASTWAGVWSSQQSTVSATIEAAAEAQLVRRNYVTTVHVLSASTVPNERKLVGGLRVVCYVEHGYTLNAQHIWSPEELASMLLLGDYSATQALYTAAAASAPASIKKAAPAPARVEALAAAAATPGSLATTRIDYDFTTKMTVYELAMIIMAACIGFVCLVAIVIACGCCCCCRRCISTRKESTPSWEADLDRYQRGMVSQDSEFASSENPLQPKDGSDNNNKHGTKGKSSGGPHGIAEDSREATEHQAHAPVSNPLSSPADAQEDKETLRGGAFSPRESEVTPSSSNQHVNPHTYDPVNKPSPAPPVESAQGVPLVATPYQAEEPAVYQQRTAPSGAAASPQHVPMYGGHRSSGGGIPNEDDAMNQTRLSQGSDRRASGESAAAAAASSPPPPAYPQYQPRHGHNSPSPPPPPAVYPSPALYTGAPSPTVASSLDSFTPMQSVLKK